MNKMSGKSHRVSRIAAAVLILCNFVTMFLCLTTFAISLWVIASPVSFAAAIEIFGSPTLKALLPAEAVSVEAGVSAAMLSGFFFFVSYMGFYGALTASQFLLFMYAALVVLLLLLECALLYYFSSSLLEKGIQEPNSTATHALRLALQCCEHNATSSVSEAARAPPWSCCGAAAYPDNCTRDTLHPAGCHQAIVVWLDRYEVPLYVCLTAFHVLLSSCSLLRRALSASHSYS